MFDKEKRKQVTTVGELKALLDGIADDAKITVCGTGTGGWIHVAKNGLAINFDYDDLDDWYEDWEDESDESTTE